jgi:hypothetical protein
MDTQRSILFRIVPVHVPVKNVINTAKLGKMQHYIPFVLLHYVTVNNAYGDSLATVKVGFYIKCPIFCPVLTKWGFPSQISIKVPNNQVSQQSVTYDLIWSDPSGQTDMKNFTRAFHKYAHTHTHTHPNTENCDITILFLLFIFIVNMPKKSTSDKKFSTHTANTGKQEENFRQWRTGIKDARTKCVLKPAITQTTKNLL